MDHPVQFKRGKKEKKKPPISAADPQNEPIGLSACPDKTLSPCLTSSNSLRFTVSVTDAQFLAHAHKSFPTTYYFDSSWASSCVVLSSTHRKKAYIVVLPSSRHELINVL